jgi:16S rRNA (cytosine1402-N4)-methyltransferase
LSLANIVERVIGRRPQDRIHPATRTFQALRMFVNDELGQLAQGLGGAENLLRENGVLAAVTFHSLEDRVVKRFFTARTGRAARANRFVPERDETVPSFRELAHKARKASDAETEINPRARSAKLRAAARTAAVAVPLDYVDLGLARMPSMAELGA